MSKFKISLLFEPRDLWVGLYWDKSGGLMTRFYICIIPMFPILIRWWHNRYSKFISFSIGY